MDFFDSPDARRFALLPASRWENPAAQADEAAAVELMSRFEQSLQQIQTLTGVDGAQRLERVIDAFLGELDDALRANPADAAPLWQPREWSHACQVRHTVDLHLAEEVWNRFLGRAVSAPRVSSWNELGRAYGMVIVRGLDRLRRRIPAERQTIWRAACETILGEFAAAWDRAGVLTPPASAEANAPNHRVSSEVRPA